MKLLDDTVIDFLSVDEKASNVNGVKVNRNKWKQNSSAYCVCVCVCVAAWFEICAMRMCVLVCMSDKWQTMLNSHTIQRAIYLRETEIEMKSKRNFERAIQPCWGSKNPDKRIKAKTSSKEYIYIYKNEQRQDNYIRHKLKILWLWVGCACSRANARPLRPTEIENERMKKERQYILQLATMKEHKIAAAQNANTKKNNNNNS